MTELEARIRAHVRRASANAQPVVTCGTLTFDSNSRQFTRPVSPLRLRRASTRCSKR